MRNHVAPEKAKGEAIQRCFGQRPGKFLLTMSRQVGSTMTDASDPVQTSHFGRRYEKCFGRCPGSLLHDPSQWTIYFGLMLDMICTRFQTHGQLRVLGRQFGKCYETCFGQRLGKLLRTTSRQVCRNIIDAAGRRPGRSFWETL